MENTEKQTEDNITAEEQREMFALFREYMEDQKKRGKKRNRLLTAVTVACLGLFCMLLLSVAVIVPRASGLLEDVDAIAQVLRAEQLTGIISDVQSFTLEAADIAGHANAVLDEASYAVKNLEQIDIEKLNEAIENLNDTVEPLANFFSLMS